MKSVSIICEIRIMIYKSVRLEIRCQRVLQFNLIEKHISYTMK